MNLVKKYILYTICVVVLAAQFVACDAFRSVTSNKVTSQGSPYELIVVCQEPLWRGALGDTLRHILREPVPSLNQTEPLFDVLRVTNRGFKDLVQKHRNILVVDIDPSVTQAKVGVAYDVYAAPQVVLTLQAPNSASAVAYLSANSAALVEVLEKTERDRDVAYANKYNEKFIEQQIEAKFGFRMNVPKGYSLRSEKESFMWISYEYPQVSQGFFIYSYPYAGASSLTEQTLVAARNRFAALIPGPSDGSYMTTFMDYTPDVEMFRIDGRLWFEMRGFWDVSGDFMGGPYVSYTTIDTENRRVVTLDCYVFSPKLGKRNYLRGLEHLVYTVKFPQTQVSK